MAKNQRMQARRLKGFRDYLPPLMSERYRLMDIVRDEARLGGFHPIGTPALEYADTLLGQGGEETDKQVYRFRDHGDREVALRFDLTVPFARFVAEHQGELAFPFKRLQIGDVWRGENTQKGRYREFGQCDLDIIGVDGAAADIEILSSFGRILRRAGIGAFTMAVGNRRLLSAVLHHMFAGLSPEGETEALIALDKLAKIGEDRVVELLTKIDGVSESSARQLLTLLLQRSASGDTDLEALRSILSSNDDALAEMERVKQVISVVRELLRPEGEGDDGIAKVCLDLTIARGLGYYTGIVFETTLDELPGFGSICSGGRYNDLASRFSSRELPGVGGSIGLDRLLAGLEELGRLRAYGEGLVFVAVATTDALDYGFEVADKLRRAGIAADIGLMPKLGAQFKHADRLGCAYVVTIGSEERETSTFSLKSMRTGEEKKHLAMSQLVAQVRQALNL